MSEVKDVLFKLMQKSRELNLISVQLFISLSKKFVKNISVRILVNKTTLL